MPASKPQLRANKAWRERTALQLVQAWLPKGVVDRLDRIVTGTGARGRAAALTRLIEGEPCPREEPAGPTTSVGDDPGESRQ